MRISPHFQNASPAINKGSLYFISGWINHSCSFYVFTLYACKIVHICMLLLSKKSMWQITTSLLGGTPFDVPRGLSNNLDINECFSSYGPSWAVSLVRRLDDAVVHFSFSSLSCRCLPNTFHPLQSVHLPTPPENKAHKLLPVYLG